MRPTAVVYTLASASAGVVFGGLWGFAGSMFSLEIRVVLASALSIPATAIGISELLGKRVPLLQIDRETPQRWVQAGPLYWAFMNGIALGFGGLTRLGFWLWYAIPLGAVLSGSVLTGTAVYGAYGLARGAFVWWAMVRLHKLGQDSSCLLKYRSVARTLAAGYQVLLGITIAIAVGI